MFVIILPEVDFLLYYLIVLKKKKKKQKKADFWKGQFNFAAWIPVNHKIYLTDKITKELRNTDILQRSVRKIKVRCDPPSIAYCLRGKCSMWHLKCSWSFPCWQKPINKLYSFTTFWASEILLSKVLLQNDTNTALFNENVTYRNRDTLFLLLIHLSLCTTTRQEKHFQYKIDLSQGQLQNLGNL